MAEINLPEALEAAEAAAENARRVRAFHRRRTDKRSKQRAQDIEIALGRIKDAMKPLRTFLGRFSYGPQTQAAHANYDKVSTASHALQAERRKLWKMQNRKPEEAP
jgi:hypothetical protein